MAYGGAAVGLYYAQHVAACRHFEGKLHLTAAVACKFGQQLSGHIEGLDATARINDVTIKRCEG